MNKLIQKYKELTNKYNYLCFKIKGDKKFTLGIVSNNGPIIIELDNKYYDMFNVKRVYDLNNFDNIIPANKSVLDLTNFDNVSYFIIRNNTLYDYYGNLETVIVPNTVLKIGYEAFKDNIFIKNVIAENTTEIVHYAFRNNPNLMSLYVPNCTWIGNILNCPNLKDYTLSGFICGFINEDNKYENSTITIGMTSYTFDSSIEEEFMKKFSVIKDNPNEQIQLVKLSKNERLFRSVNNDKRNQTIIALANTERLFSSLPDTIKDIFYMTNHELYIVDCLPEAGWYIEEDKSIILREDGILLSFYHEFGHMIDAYLNHISSTEDFIRIYKMEANNLYKSDNSSLRYKLFDHCTKDEHEYFAESIQRYLRKDESFLLDCPNTYNFIKEIFKELENNHNYNYLLKLDK